MQQMRIVLIGAGNLGYHLGCRLAEQGQSLLQIFSRTIDHARKLSEATGVPYVTKLQNIRLDADLYLLAVNDRSIAEVGRHLRGVGMKNGLVAHTSGATPGTVLKPFFQRYGVFYPLQSFSSDRPVDFARVPICVEAANPDDEEHLLALARTIGKEAYRINDEQRAVLHVAAVFVNNFTNLMYQTGYDILEEENLPFDLLRPLIEETAAKIGQNPPAEMQTGPAVRGDETTIQRHLDYLEKFPDYRRLYKVLTGMLQEG